MSSLLQLASDTSTPIQTVLTTNFPVVEPLDGPTSVDDVFDRFPEEVYQQGKDTHLYRFLTALAGDAGAGYLKKQAYAARLKWEAEFINFKVLDDLYAAQFRFKRLRSETYSENPQTDALTPEQWDALNLADDSYRHRTQEFFTAIRMGTSPGGMEMMVTAGSGLDNTLIENYKYIFDTYSDDQLGLEPQGTTLSPVEMVSLVRDNGEIFSGYTDEGTVSTTNAYSNSQNGVVWEFTAPVLNGAVGRPATLTSPAAVTKTYSVTVPKLLPEIERNVIDVTDRLRPVGTILTINLATTLYDEVDIDTVAASSERINLSRFIEGRTDVAWPTVDPSQGYFIEGGTENEATTFFGAGRELPVVFYTSEVAISYTERALLDPDYQTPTFYTPVSGFAPVQNYTSEHYGVFLAVLIGIYPFLSSVTPDVSFVSQNSIAIQNTPLVMEAPPVVS